MVIGLVLSFTDGGRWRREGIEAPAELFWLLALELGLQVGVDGGPDGQGRDQSRMTGRGQGKAARSLVPGVRRRPRQAFAFQHLESRRQRGSVRPKKPGDISHRRRRRTVQSIEQRELAVGQPHGPQGVIEPARQGAGRPLRMQTKTVVPDMQRIGEGHGLGHPRSNVDINL